MSPSELTAESSTDLLRRIARGDEMAAEAVFRRYAERLTRLARSRLSARLAARVDADDIVSSAYRSFFVAAREGRFAVARGGDLWRLLGEITLHKLYRQAEHHRAQRRSVQRESSQDTSLVGALISREPSPEDAVAAVDELERLLKQLSERERFKSAGPDSRGGDPAGIAFGLERLRAPAADRRGRHGQGLSRTPAVDGQTGCRQVPQEVAA